MRLRGRVPFALVLLASLGCAACREAPSSTDSNGRPQRLVLITLDTLRWDAFAGGERGESAMPLLAARAEQGVVFERHYASSSTTQPTHASLFTGRHPWEHGVIRNGVALTSEEPTIAEILQEEGFWTAAAVASFPVTSRFRYDRGFDVFREDFNRKYAGTWNEEKVDEGNFYRLGDAVSEAALQLITTAPAQDQFLWLHYFDPHSPYGDTGDKPITRKSHPGAFRNPDRIWEAYRLDVAALDQNLDRVIGSLFEEDGFDTHVVLTADHGESIGDNKSIGHGTRLNDAEIHVPLVVLSPALSPARRSDPCGSVDVFATLLGLAGLDSSVLEAGHDLLAAGPSPQPVMGMRRIFVESERETLTNGSLRIISGHQFYVVESARTVRGNERRISVEGDPLGESAEAQYLELFGALGRTLDSLEFDELIDDGTQKGLEALGYAR